MKRVAVAPDLARGIAARLTWHSALALLACTAAACPLRAQFTLQDSGTSADLRGIVNVGNGTAWASGMHGTVLRTEDSGFVWQGCAVPPGAEGLDFRGIQAFDDQTAIVMSSGKGDLSRVYKTTDGCKSWKLVFTNPDADGFFDAVSIAPPYAWQTTEQYQRQAFGQILGDPVSGKFAIFVTADAGNTWERRSAESRRDGHPCDQQDFPAVSGESAFAASNQALIAYDETYGEQKLVFVSGGAETKLRFVEHTGFNYNACHAGSVSLGLPLAQGSGSEGAFAVASKFPEAADYLPLFLMVVGGDYQHPDDVSGTAASLRKRSGVSLPFSSRFIVEKAHTMPHGFRSSVAYDAKAKAWITVGPNGTDMSTDDGRNWRALKPGYGDDPSADKQWNALSLPYVVGPHGRIGRLRDDALTPGK